MGFSRQEYCSGLPCLPPGDLSNPGMERRPLMSPALAGGSFTTSTNWESVHSRERSRMTQQRSRVLPLGPKAAKRNQYLKKKKCELGPSSPLTLSVFFSPKQGQLKHLFLGTPPLEVLSLSLLRHCSSTRQPVSPALLPVCKSEFPGGPVAVPLTITSESLREDGPLAGTPAEYECRGQPRMGDSVVR